MCGIAGIFNIKSQTPELRRKALKMAQKIRHRGPDWSGIFVGGSAILAHERLSIVDPQSGGQPLYSPDRKQILAVNGEIYNHREIRSKYAGKYAFQTGSDCEVILALYKDKGINFLEDLNGIFAFALYDEETDDFLIARDPIGVIPLYIGKDADGKVYCASELKALEGFCEEYEPFLPGHYYWGREGKMHRWYKRDWMEYDAVKDNDAKVSDVHACFTSSIVVLSPVKTTKLGFSESISSLIISPTMLSFSKSLSSPTSMSNTDIARNVFLSDKSFQFGDLPFRLIYI
jgi:Asparagine synthase (glutamine-hydrolyzing)